MKPRIVAHFREQGGHCAAYGSPFTGALCERFAEDLEAGGPIADLVSGWSTNPRADALALRLAGALHAAALSRRDPELAALYFDLTAAGSAPSPLAEEGRVGGADANLYKSSAHPHPLPPPRTGEGGVVATGWSIDTIWPVARTFLAREQAWVRDFLHYAPQTNETRRSIALLAGFLAFAEHWRGPIDMLEIGASAGLNLNWDKFSYKTASWRWGDPGGVVIDTNWQGAPPPAHVIPIIRNRAACDLNPLDIRDPEQALRLKSYIWPDQPDRLARFDGALKLALARDTRVERADAATWLKAKLASRAGDAATIVYHSVFLQYPPRESRTAIIDAIRAAGAAATAQAPLAWVRLEPEAVTDGVENGLRFVIDLTTWPGGQRRILGYTDGHVRSVHAV
jgi:hypothetical protein